MPPEKCWIANQCLAASIRRLKQLNLLPAPCLIFLVTSYIFVIHVHFNKAINKAWKDIADSYNDNGWAPINPVIDPFNKDDFGNPIPVHNCSQKRFEQLQHIDPNSDQIRKDATPGFVQVDIIVPVIL
jgi:hypothetical protein